jgi:hypothetical protein
VDGGYYDYVLKAYADSLKTNHQAFLAWEK